MTFPLFRVSVAAAIALLLAALMAIPVAADQVYRTERLPLAPTDDAPLRSGSVVNIHANGPRIYAHEVYMLNGAEPNTSYDVVLNVYTQNLECVGDANLALPTATLTTNVAGNGRADAFFAPEDVEGLRGSAVSAYWSVGRDGDVTYVSGCTQITLD